MAIDGTINRRGLFSGAAAAFVGGRLGLNRDALTQPETFEASFVSAARVGETDGGIVLDSEGLAVFALPARGHAIARLPDGRVLLVGRRPGTFAAIIDPDAPERTAQLTPIKGHRFAGHAAVSADGRTLVTSEIDAETGEGAAVPRNGQSGAPLTSFTVGIEPHDVLFAKGGARLVVAVGGIARSAETKGSPAMNAGNIESAIVELDPKSGAVLKRHVLLPPMRSLSLRHMALAPDGETIAFGMQDQDRSTLRPLLGVLRVGGGIELLPLPEDDEGALRSYVGSVAIDVSGCYAAATSPKGGIAGLWRLSDGRWLGGFKCQDVCGLTAGAAPASFWATSGLGDVVRLGADDAGFTVEARWRAPAAFDNHLLRI